MCMPESFSQEFAASTRFYYRVSNMANPEWGIVRPQSGTFNWDFDANDFDVFTQYDIWTNQFDVSVY